MAALDPLSVWVKTAGIPLLSHGGPIMYLLTERC